jgi:hypothetical protein
MIGPTYIFGNRKRTMQSFGPAAEHIRVMEQRIEQQSVMIQRLHDVRQDASGAISRLNLLRAALAEMRVQLAHLAPTPMDAKNGRTVEWLSRLARA